MSEEGIDMERCLLGVDDEDTWGTEITWTNCAEKLPSNTDKVIVSYKDGYPRLVIGSALCQWVRRGEVYFKWTEFTKEKWEALNASNSN